MLDAVVRRLTELQYERALRQLYLASSVKIGPEFPFANAAAIGTGKPMIVVNSGTVTLLDEVELRTVVAHEVGHILSDHVLYRTALMILLRLGTAVRLPLIAGMPLLAVRSALLEWSRTADLPRRGRRRRRRG
jgi:Zn-dependent protease with chaperone function